MATPQSTGKALRIRREEINEIKSAIPDHLLSSATPSDRHMIGTASILEQRTNLTWEKLVECDIAMASIEDRQNILESRTKKLELIHEKLKSIWVLILACGAVLTFILKVLEIIWGIFHK